MQLRPQLLLQQHHLNLRNYFRVRQCPRLLLQQHHLRNYIRMQQRPLLLLQQHHLNLRNYFRVHQRPLLPPTTIRFQEQELFPGAATASTSPTTIRFQELFPGAATASTTPTTTRSQELFPGAPPIYYCKIHPQYWWMASRCQICRAGIRTEGLDDWLAKISTAPELPKYTTVSET